MDTPAADLSPGKAYHFLCSVVAPRPIAWVTTVSQNGVVNAAPFSWFQAVCADPMMVMLAVVDRDDGTLKDTARNVQESKEFVVNIATAGQLPDLVATSGDFAADESELAALGLAASPAASVRPPRIDGCAAHLECRLVETRRYGRGKKTTVLVGEVLHVAARDDMLTERGILHAVRAGLPARLGGIDYLTVTETFEVPRPPAP